MKLFVVLNEHEPKAHIDVYNALDNLLIKKKVDDYQIYPFIHKMSTGLRNDEVVNDIKQKIIDFSPELILFSHISGLNIKSKILKEIRKLHPKTVLAYRDGDIYHPFYKPMPKEILRLLSECDVSFWCGIDYYVKQIINSKKDVRYVPSVTDTMRFNKMESDSRQYDVIMIGNYVKSTIPFKVFPGSRERKKLADLLYKKLGNKFAVFGNGWDAKYSNGPIEFEKQNYLYSKSRITVAVNNLHADYYFSNRMPIALSSGIIILNNYENGIEFPYSETGYNYFFKDNIHAWKLTKTILDKSQNDLDKYSLVYSAFARSKLSMEYSLMYIIDVMKSYYYSENRTQIPSDIENPWLNGITLKPYRIK